MRNSIIKQYLQERMNIFYQEMREYLAAVQNQNRAKTLALRFLASAQKQDESSAEKEIRNMKKNSIFLFPSLEFPKNKNSITKNKKISSFFPKSKIKEEDEKSASSSNSLDSLSSPKKIQEGDELEMIHTESKKSALDEHAVQRPTLKYIPEDWELRTMMRKAIRK